MTTPTPSPVEECPECPRDGRHCAPRRCYCGHTTCPARKNDPYWKRPR